MEQEAHFLPDEERAQLLRRKRDAYLRLIVGHLADRNYTRFMVPHITFRKRGEGIENAFVTTTSGNVFLTQEGSIMLNIEDKAVGREEVFTTEMHFLLSDGTSIDLHSQMAEDCEYLQRQNTILFDVVAGLSSL